MNVTTITTANTRYIPTRILKGDSYLYAHTYFEAGDYGIMALDPDTLSVLDTFKYQSDRISDFSVYSDSRIAIRSDNKLAVLSFNGTSFSVLCSVGIKSPINNGVTCNSNFAFASTGSKIVSLDISTGKTAQMLNTPDFYYSRGLACTDDYLFVRECRINLDSFRLAAYEINSDYITNPHRNLYLLDSISSPIFDQDLGRLTVDPSSLEIIETGLYTNRLITFSGSAFTVVGEITPFYPALEFVKHGSYYFISPDKTLRVFSRSGLVLTVLFTGTLISKYASYRCPGFSSDEFFSSRDILGDGIGINVSKNQILP
jgi:hypothetical protein